MTTANDNDRLPPVHPGAERNPVLAYPALFAWASLFTLCIFFWALVVSLLR